MTPPNANTSGQVSIREFRSVSVNTEVDFSKLPLAINIHTSVTTGAVTMPLTAGFMPHIFLDRWDYRYRHSRRRSRASGGHTDVMRIRVSRAWQMRVDVTVCED